MILLITTAPMMKVVLVSHVVLAVRELKVG
jgi:hypothetical protein